MATKIEDKLAIVESYLEARCGDLGIKPGMFNALATRLIHGDLPVFDAQGNFSQDRCRQQAVVQAYSNAPDARACYVQEGDAAKEQENLALAANELERRQSERVYDSPFSRQQFEALDGERRNAIFTAWDHKQKQIAADQRKQARNAAIESLLPPHFQSLSLQARMMIHDEVCQRLDAAAKAK